MKNYIVETRYIFRSKKFVVLTFFNNFFTLCYLHSHPVICTYLLLAKKYLRTFDVM